MKANEQSGVSRRQVIAFGAASAFGAVLPAWPYDAFAMVNPIANPAPDIGEPPRLNGLSPSIRFWYSRVVGAWRHYLRELDELRGIAHPETFFINVQRRILEPKIEYLSRMVPETEDDRLAWSFTVKIVRALLADFPNVPWRPDLLASLTQCQFRNAA